MNTNEINQIFMNVKQLFILSERNHILHCELGDNMEISQDSIYDQVFEFGQINKMIMD